VGVESIAGSEGTCRVPQPLSGTRFDASCQRAACRPEDFHTPYIFLLPQPDMRLFLIRHGESEHNVAQKL
jgi:hypothetical protein